MHMGTGICLLMPNRPMRAYSALRLLLGLGRGGAFLEHLGIERLELELLFLDHRHVLAARLALGLVLGAGDVERHADDDLGVQRDARLSAGRAS